MCLVLFVLKKFYNNLSLWEIWFGQGIFAVYVKKKLVFCMLAEWKTQTHSNL
jgi:hypothetical protein